jgi:hypothetical protein
MKKRKVNALFLNEDILSSSIVDNSGGGWRVGSHYDG